MATMEHPRSKLVVQARCGPRVVPEEAREAADEFGASARLGCALLVQCCMQAVRLGAPLYNAGALTECVALYQECAQACLAHRIGLPSSVIAPLEGALDEVSHELVGDGLSRHAWVLRRALDRAIGAAVAIASASSPSSPPASPPRRLRSPPPTTSCHLLALPDDIAAMLLCHTAAASLGALSGTCRSLRAQVHSHASAAVARARPALVRSLGGDDYYPARWARALHAIELLEARVPSPPPRGRQWWDEWPRLRAAETVRAGGAPVDDMRAFMEGGDRSVGAMLRRHAAGIRWMVDRGWTPSHAAAAMLLLSCGAETHTR